MARVRERRYLNQANEDLRGQEGARNVLLNSIRSIIDQTSHRRDLLSQLNDTELRSLDATQRSKELSLRQYINSLKKYRHAEYTSKDGDMPDCVICLLDFHNND